MHATAPHSPSSLPGPPGRGLATRSRGKLLALFVASLVAIYLCWQMAAPFLPAIVLAFTLAIVTHRPFRWLAGKLSSRRTLASLVATAVIALTFLLPVTAIAYFVTIEIGETVSTWKPDEIQNRWDSFLGEHPRLQRAWRQIARGLDLQEQIPRALNQVQRSVAAIVQGAVYLATQGALTLFFLFFLYRDSDAAIRAVRRIMPLDDRETDEYFQRVEDTVHATMFGVVLVAIIQGALGGAMLAVLGVPGAVLWGVVMGMLAIVPYLGTFVIWGPTAAILAMQGETMKAIVLVSWGLIAIGLIDNMLYPMMVGQRLQQHTAVAFIAILGGVALFGAMGIVLGPLIVATSLFLLDVWRRRTAYGGDAERA
jgi:predicted PurR-regulated permease PerM